MGILNFGRSAKEVYSVSIVSIANRLQNCTGGTVGLSDVQKQ